MNPLDKQNLITEASKLGLSYGDNALIQIQAIFAPIVAKLWNKVGTVKDILNNWDNVIGDDRLDNYYETVSKLPAQEQFFKILTEEVNILIQDLLKDIKSYIETSIITIDDIYGTIYAYDPYMVDTTKWSVLLGLFKPRNSITYQTLKARPLNQYIKNTVTDDLIKQLLYDVNDKGIIDPDVYDLIRRYLSSPILSNFWNTGDITILANSSLYEQLQNSYNHMTNVAIFIIVEILEEAGKIANKKSYIDVFSILEACKTIKI